MSDKKQIPLSNFKMLVILLGLQLLLPFLLYLFFKHELIWGTYIIAAFYFLSILAVIWVK